MPGESHLAMAVVCKLRLVGSLLVLLSVACRKPVAPKRQLEQFATSPIIGTCSPTIIRKHDPPIRWHRGEMVGHVGVDIAGCDETVVSMGEGVVMWVSNTAGKYERYVGETVYVSHDVGPSEAVAFAYVHLSNVRVKDGQAIQRGTPIGDTWKSDDYRWKRHVHIDCLSEGSSETDPLQFIVGCKATKSGELTFPFRCRIAR